MKICPARTELFHVYNEARSCFSPKNGFKFSIRRVKIRLNYGSLYEYILFRVPCVCAGYSKYRFIFQYSVELISVFLA